MKNPTRLRTLILALACAFVLLTAALPAAADCLPCFTKIPDYCGGTGDDVYTAGVGETVAGYYGDDELYGNTGNEKICGNWDNDFIHGGVGNDSLDGNAKNDEVYAGLGTDWAGGGSGDDMLFGEDPPSFDTFNGGSGYDRCYGGDVVSGCEWIVPDP